MGFFDIMKEPPLAWEDTEGFPLFNRISIETSSYCNRACSFCPVSTGRRPLQKFMSEECYSAILAELARFEFDGVAQMFLLNEPTLDKHLKDRCRQMRAACPQVSMYISTNADLLLCPEELLDWFSAGVNCVNLNIYDAGTEQHDRLWALAKSGAAAGYWDLTEHKYRKHGARKRLVAVTDMRPERLTSSKVDMFYDRTSEERHESLKAPCARPHRHIVVLWDGAVPLCCALDPTTAEQDGLVVGRVPEQTLWEIWQSETMWKYRWHLQQSRRDLPGCSTCNHRMAYSHVVRRVTASEEVLRAWE